MGRGLRNALVGGSVVVCLAVVGLTPGGGTSVLAQTQDEPFPPFRMADNLYHVGTRGLSTFLFTTSDGLILINADYERDVPVILANVEALGFDVADIRILLTSHAHRDHMEGTAAVVEQTGAQVFVMEGDEDVVRTGGNGSWAPAAVDRVLQDRDEVTLGDVTLVAHKTAGHTPGCTTWSTTVTDGGVSYDAVIVCANFRYRFPLVNNPTYPTIADDTRRTHERLQSLPADIWASSHGGVWGMPEKVERLEAGAYRNPFVDPEGYQAHIQWAADGFAAALLQAETMQAEYERQQAEGR